MNNINYWSNLNISSNVIGNSNGKYNFPHKLFLMKTQVLTLRKASTNNLLAIIRLSKNKLHKIGQSRWLKPLKILKDFKNHY